MQFAARLPCFAAIVMTVLSACSSHQGALGDRDAGAPAPVHCAPELPTACPDVVPGFASDVQPVIEARCTSCHGQLEGFWPLSNYKEVTDWKDLVRSMVLDCTMPPADAGVDMTNDERNTVLTWLSCGTPM